MPSAHCLSEKNILAMICENPFQNVGDMEGSQTNYFTVGDKQIKLIQSSWYILVPDHVLAVPQVSSLHGTKGIEKATFGGQYGVTHFNCDLQLSC